MNHSNLFKKILLILTLCILGISILYYFLFGILKKTNEHTSNLGHDLILQNKKQDYMSAMRLMVQETDTQIIQINNSIVPADGEVHFIESIESIAQSVGLKITIDSLTLEDDTLFEGGDVTSLKISAKTEGSWFATYSFLTQIESLPFKIKVDRFGMVNAVDTGSLVDPKKKDKVVSDWNTSFQIHVLKYK